MSQQAQQPSYACPHCEGRLNQCNDPQDYECSHCERCIRGSVVERMERFKRVAESDGPLSEIAQAALEGER